MLSQSIKASFITLRNSNSCCNGVNNGVPSSRIIVVQNSSCQKCCSHSTLAKCEKFPSLFISGGALFFQCLKSRNRGSSTRCIADENQRKVADVEEEDLCPVECVREFKTDEELFRILEKAKDTNALVVVDFYRTSCGSCKYIEQGFTKLCKGSGDEDVPVIFLKHNVIDEYDEQSEVAERLRIKTVPLFHFYKDGVLVESFATRDKERINEAIHKHTSSIAQET